MVRSFFLPVSPLSSLPASEPPPLEEIKDSREGDRGSKQGAMRKAGGGDGEGAPTPGLLWRSPKPCR